MTHIAPDKLSALMYKATQAFWEQVVLEYPEAKSGDLSPLTTFHFEEAAENAIKEWIFANVFQPSTMSSLNRFENSQLLGSLPCRSVQRDDPDSNLDISIWRSSENQCEFQYDEDDFCDTVASVYYGSAEDDVTRFCPKHFYQMHCGPNSVYVLQN